MLAHRTAGKGLELAYHVDPRVPAGLRSDADRLRQVLVNLVNNAIKFTERGEVVVRAAPDDAAAGAEAGAVRFTVTDSGVGIPAEPTGARRWTCCGPGTNRTGWSSATGRCRR